MINERRCWQNMFENALYVCFNFYNHCCPLQHYPGETVSLLSFPSFFPLRVFLKLLLSYSSVLLFFFSPCFSSPTFFSTLSQICFFGQSLPTRHLQHRVESQSVSIYFFRKPHFFSLKNIRLGESDFFIPFPHTPPTPFRPMTLSPAFSLLLLLILHSVALICFVPSECPAVPYCYRMLSQEKAY